MALPDADPREDPGQQLIGVRHLPFRDRQDRDRRYPGTDGELPDTSGLAAPKVSGTAIDSRHVLERSGRRRPRSMGVP